MKGDHKKQMKLLEFLNRKSFSELPDANEEQYEDFLIQLLRKGSSVEKIGGLFEKSLTRLERKSKGQYYTPKPVVEYIISYLEIKENSKILDPACGCGSFLLSVLDFLICENMKRSLGNVFGVDINETAVEMTRSSLGAKARVHGFRSTQFEKNIRLGNSIVSNKDMDELAFNWNEEFEEILNLGGFDFVIGNPPYVTLRKHKDFDPKESIYSRITYGPVNAATLMIGRSLELLKNNGILAFVLPKTILHVESYSKMRNYLLEKTKILHIFNLGQKFEDVRGEQVILIVKKVKPDLERHKVTLRFLKFKEKPLSEQPTLRIPQAIFSEFGKFLVFDKEEYYTILEKIDQQRSSLDEYVDGKIFRGLGIGGNSPFIKKNMEIGYEKVIRGKNISKFKITKTLFVNQDILRSYSENKLERIRQPKVVLQNIFSSESGAIAAYDDKGLLTLDTVTNIIAQDAAKAKYILALLNSKLINFYIIYGLFNRSRLTMHADKTYLGQIPITKKPEKSRLAFLVNYVDQAAKENTQESLKRIIERIDDIIYDMYGLAKTERECVESALKDTFSKKSWW